MLAALGLFFLFQSLDLGRRRALNAVAGTSLGVYILHQVPALRDVLWNGIFQAQAHHGSALYALFVVAATFAGCAAIDALRTRLVMRPLQNTRLFRAVCQKGDALAALIERCD